jgi:hypothetical protein
MFGIVPHQPWIAGFDESEPHVVEYLWNNITKFISS